MIACVLCMCQAVGFLRVISLGFLKDRFFRQSNWVVMFRNVWKRKEIGDKNLTVITSDLTCNYIGMEKKK